MLFIIILYAVFSTRNMPRLKKSIQVSNLYASQSGFGKFL